MALPRPKTTVEAVLIAVGGLLSLIIVLPMVPLVVEFVVGVVQGVLNVVVPGGRTYE